MMLWIWLGVIIVTAIIELVTIDLVSIWFTPVSYTHLDVYKRQVIHCAAFKAVGESVEKPIEYYTNNLTTTLIVAKMMKKYGVNNIVFSSSATVYGLSLIHI